jgi:hypothetical protein
MREDQDELLTLRDALKFLGAKHDTRSVDRLRFKARRAEKSQKRVILTTAPCRISLKELKLLEPTLFLKKEKAARIVKPARLYSELTKLITDLVQRG